MENSDFFCHSDFTWNQIWWLWKLKICQSTFRRHWRLWISIFCYISALENSINLWHLAVQSPQNCWKMSVFELLPYIKLVSRKIWENRKILKFPHCATAGLFLWPFESHIFSVNSRWLLPLMKLAWISFSASFKFCQKSVRVNFIKLHNFGDIQPRRQDWLCQTNLTLYSTHFQSITYRFEEFNKQFLLVFGRIEQKSFVSTQITDFHIVGLLIFSLCCLPIRIDPNLFDHKAQLSNQISRNLFACNFSVNSSISRNKSWQSKVKISFEQF